MTDSQLNSRSSSESVSPELEIDTTNWALVASRGDGITFIRPAHLMQMTNEQALVVAAYIVAIVGDEDLWRRVREAVEAL